VAGVYKPLRALWFWVGLWWLAVLVVIAVCLGPPPALDLPQNSDKVEHFLAYFLLAGSAVQVYRTGRALVGVGVGLVGLGIAIEFAQSALTATRVADPWDALANTLGVCAGLAIAHTRLRDVLPRRKPAGA